VVRVHRFKESTELVKPGDEENNDDEVQSDQEEDESLLSKSFKKSAVMQSLDEFGQKTDKFFNDLF